MQKKRRELPPLSFFIESNFLLVGANFIFELLFNVVLSPVVVRLIRIGKKEV